MVKLHLVCWLRQKEQESLRSDRPVAYTPDDLPADLEASAFSPGHQYSMASAEAEGTTWLGKLLSLNARRIWDALTPGQRQSHKAKSIQGSQIDVICARCTCHLLNRETRIKCDR